jgi:hypothetical protein
MANKLVVPDVVVSTVSMVKRGTAGQQAEGEHSAAIIDGRLPPL